MKNNKLYTAILDYLNTYGVERSEEDNIKALVKGIEILIFNKKYYPSYQSMKDSFYQAKGVILDFDLSENQEDLLIEMEAIIINHYNMPDFWDSSLQDFQKDEFYKRFYR
jgi:hypothetical protein